jgi:pyruvate ferredoxin oxidoreductase beta subunit
MKFSVNILGLGVDIKMAINLKELTTHEEKFTSGHRLCGGCGAALTVRHVLMASDKPVVVGCATGCLEVSTTIYPYTNWNASFIHTAFENSAATISGVESAFKALKKRNGVEADYNFVAFGGDGGTYDIGLQSLSGAMERGHRMLYVCYDNGAYMNTGIQRSGATPLGAATSTTPPGKQSSGKPQLRKDLTAIMAAHRIPYVAQTTVANWRDLISKAQKAFAVDGPSFINVLSPCPRGWRSDSADSIELCKMAVKSNFWPLYEIENGVWKINSIPREKIPVADFLKKQGRFKHLFKPENEEVLEQVQRQIDIEWERLLKRTEE